MNELAQHWRLDPALHFLNHGSFGATPRRVLEHQRRLQDQLESQPVKFMQRDLPGLLSAARNDLASFLGAAPEDLVFVTNATTGVNSVLRSLRFAEEDELLVTDHAYPACRAALEFVASRSGANVKVVGIPLEADTGEIVDRIAHATTDRTRLLLVDHVSSATSVVHPVQQIVTSMEHKGVDVLIDGAHAPGMVELNLASLGAAYYAGNCHKWMCAPKGAGFLHVRADRQHSVFPTVISHGFATAPADARFQPMFDWIGTADPTPALSVGLAIDTVAALVPGGWPEIMKRNRGLAAVAAGIVGDALGSPPRTPSSMAGSMVSFQLPPGYPSGARWDPLQDELLFDHGVEVPISPWPEAPHRLLRISAHVYNDVADYRALATALTELI